MPELSVVVPVYDEADGLQAFADALVPVLEAHARSWELIFVDDGSRDRSWHVLGTLRAVEPRILLVKLSRNFGHQLAITAGMDHATGDAVVVMDADLQDPPSVLPQMLAQWRDGFDVVYGVRETRQEGWFKRASAAVFYRLLAAMSPIAIPVDAGDFRLMSRRAVEALGQMPERARYVRGMVAWVGFPTAAVPFQRAARHAGQTKYPLRKMLSFAADGLVSFSAVPLRIATSLGFLMAMAALLYFFWAVAMKLFGATIQGWTSLVAVVVFIGSAQLLCLGIIGEYVGRIYDEVKGRPLYVVERVERTPAG
jgi:dolichol-phosphate mannosyltransferase